MIAAFAAAAAPPVVIAAVAGNLLLLLLLRWLLLLQLLCCQALPLPAGGGAVTGADTVAIDCRYGPCKSSVSVMKISKRIREEEKTYRGLQTHLHLKSPIPIQQWPQRCMLVMVGDGCCVFGRTWWWEGGRTREVTTTKGNST